MKILHISVIDKFVPPYINFIKENFDFSEHTFVILGDTQKYPIDLRENFINIKNKTQFFLLLRMIKEINKSDKIILHGLFSQLLNVILILNFWVLKKCYWVIWGGDLYEIKNSLQTFVIKHIEHFITYIRGDYELVQKLYNKTGIYHNCLMYPSNLYQNYTVHEKNHSVMNLLVGNSATRSNNHLEVFKKLEGLKKIKIYAPLSYGELDYRQQIIEQGGKRFGANFIPLTDFLSIDKYLEILGQIDIALFNNDRQQAMGNIITLLGLGKKVYLRNDTTQWRLFKELGINIFDIENINLDNIDKEQAMQNNIKIKNYFSKENLILQWGEIFEKKGIKKLGFYILNQKGFTALNDFINKFSSDHIGFVVSSEDKGNNKDYFEEIKTLCVEHKIKFFRRGEPLSDTDYESVEYTFAIGWRWLISDSEKLIVLHDSLLPKYRGFAPLVNMLINKEKKIGVTAIMAADEYDIGSIISQKSISIEYPLKINKAIDNLSVLYSKLIIEISEKLLINGSLGKVYSQDENQASYSLWRDDFDYFINWNQSANNIQRFCDAVGYPYAGASTYIGSKKIRIIDVEEYKDVLIEDRLSHIGKVIFFKDGHPIIVCQEGLLKILEAVYDKTEESIIGNMNFRTRFTSLIV